MHRVIWQRAALRDLAAIRAYFDRFNPYAASDLFARLLAAGNSLAKHPERGRPVRGNRRELVAVWPYGIGYIVGADTVRIIRVRHGARRPNGT